MQNSNQVEVMLEYEDQSSPQTLREGLALDDEAVVKISSMLGTAGGMSVLKGYMLPESKEICGDLGISDILKTAANSLVLVPRTVWRCLRMAERWPWGDFDEYMDCPLHDIRQQFGIKVVR
ncbi:MAG: hypothetical protein ACI9ON_001447 [Limisphaerales bacterium]